eukprot:SAG31_NODE_3746_length_3928_cov_4.375555_4_plen_151_part_00
MNTIFSIYLAIRDLRCSAKRRIAAVESVRMFADLSSRIAAIRATAAALSSRCGTGMAPASGRVVDLIKFVEFGSCSEDDRVTAAAASRSMALLRVCVGLSVGGGLSCCCFSANATSPGDSEPFSGVLEWLVTAGEEVAEVGRGLNPCCMR